MRYIGASLLLLLARSAVEGFCPTPVSRAEPSRLWLSIEENEEESALIREEVSRRVALVMAAATFAAGTNLRAAEAISLSNEVEALEFENLATVNTNGAPEKHLPKTTVKGTSVEVVVPHVMDPEKPHFIEYVWLKDEANNKVISAQKFEATDASPPTLKATVRKGTKVKPLLFCNLHGLWQGEALTV